MDVTHSPHQPASDRRNNDPNHGTSQRVSEAVTRGGQAAAEHLIATPAKDILQRLQQYAHEKPDVAVCWCFALGVVVGWKLRS
ncbi:hypothetical protein FF011L_29330 [Roseimaritima multifibrata]|uniref:DUF883 domain-containing protein n=1 Tax=Roseimaritima multifibrata TaxID=1930274 RepID=A0A517MH05_9BACT|nr:hypothetical protein [Roseimaritima multifibrata]QDS94155.1 hypothetical protein FF011L_29330 [Roseimaritima multifibrata]